QAFTGTGELHYYEVHAWAQGEQAHAEFEAQLDRDIVDIHRLLGLDVFHPPWRFHARPTRQIDEYTFLFGDTDDAHCVYQYNPASGDFACIHAAESKVPFEVRLRERLERLERIDPQEQARAAREMIDLQRRLGDEFVLAPSGC